MNGEIFYGNIPQECLILDKNEVAARLKTARDYTSGMVDYCEERLRGELNCGYSAVISEVRYDEEKRIDLGFGYFESESLFKNLKSVDKAYIFAVTLGYSVDRLIAKLAVSSAAEHFITDALASAFAEAVCDYTEAAIRGDTLCRPRFSPGYGDLPLEIQPQVLNMASAASRLNITLNNSLLMSPSKSITAIMGIVK